MVLSFPSVGSLSRSICSNNRANWLERLLGGDLSICYVSRKDLYLDWIMVLVVKSLAVEGGRFLLPGGRNCRIWVR